MVLSWKPDTLKPRLFSLPRTSRCRWRPCQRFLLVFEDVFVCRIKKSRKTFNLLELLDGDVFELFCEKFAIDGSRDEKGEKYNELKEAFLNK